jgi:hypothetical protein
MGNVVTDAGHNERDPNAEWIQGQRIWIIQNKSNIYCLALYMVHLVDCLLFSNGMSVITESIASV